MSERDFSIQEPTYEPDVHSEVARECLEAWRSGRPWTRIRVLQEGTDNPSGHTCSNRQGQFHEPCDGKIEAVQYTSAQGVPMFYCEEHALFQVKIDVSMYDTERPTYEDDPGAVEGETVADQVKRNRKKNREPEPKQEEEEYEP